MLPAASGGSPAPFGGFFEVFFFVFGGDQGGGEVRGGLRWRLAPARPPSGRGAEGVREAAAPGR